DRRGQGDDPQRAQPGQVRPDRRQDQGGRSAEEPPGLRPREGQRPAAADGHRRLAPRGGPRRPAAAGAARRAEVGAPLRNTAPPRRGARPRRRAPAGGWHAVRVPRFVHPAPGVTLWAHMVPGPATDPVLLVADAGASLALWPQPLISVLAALLPLRCDDHRDTGRSRTSAAADPDAGHARTSAAADPDA